MTTEMTITDDLLERAAKLSAASLHEAAGRVGALPACLRPLDPSMHVAGRAFPVRCPSGDNLWIHHALVAAEPGDVLVVDGGPGGAGFGYWGEIMANAALTRGIGGLIISGGVRDIQRLIELALPTFSISVTIRGTGKDPAGDGSIADPVRIGEVLVRRGDLILGDADGVVALTPDQAIAAIPKAEARDAAEISIIERIRQGATTLEVYDL